DGTGDLKKSAPIVTYCASGYRASIAASLLKQEGFEDVRTLPGSWKAWKSQGFPVENEESSDS
ncbi:MAG: rhodanese-like domain-containing protein, partial [Verrucomicrobiales bacterium]|nr:rhodanese-like domain-containing protein [Verrucomicrobiales bacterium]